MTFYRNSCTLSVKFVCIFPTKLYYISDCGYRYHDIIFGIPITQMVSEENFQSLKEVVKSFLKRADKTNGQSHAGFFVFDDRVRQSSVINLAEFDNSSVIVDAIDSEEYRLPPSGQVVLTEALMQFLAMFNSSNRANAPNLAYMTVDTSMDFTGALEMAEKMLDNGIYLHVAAVGFNDTDTLMQMTEGRILDLETYDMFQYISNFGLFQYEECSKYNCLSVSVGFPFFCHFSDF